MCDGRKEESWTDDDDDNDNANTIETTSIARAI